MQNLVRKFYVLQLEYLESCKHFLFHFEVRNCQVALCSGCWIWEDLFELICQTKWIRIDSLCHIEWIISDFVKSVIADFQRIAKPSYLAVSVQFLTLFIFLHFCVHFFLVSELNDLA